MKVPLISAVVSSCGAPFASDYLATLPDWGEAVVVVDVLGRKAANFARAYPLERFVEDVQALPCKPRVLLHESTRFTWSVMNGCYNAGARATSGKYLLFTHDDVTWPHGDGLEDLLTRVRRTLQWVDRTPLWDGRRPMGVVLPEYETKNEVLVPAEVPHPITLTQFYSPVTHFLARAAWSEMGMCDEKEGVWYDGQIEEEAKRRGWVFACPQLPDLPRHESNATFRTNGWGKRWTLNPKWGKYAENFARVYGHPPERRASEIWLTGTEVPRLW